MSIGFEGNIRWTNRKPKSTPDEKVLYEQGDVRITNQLAIFGENSYSIWLITSAGKHKSLKESRIPLVIITFAALLIGEGWDDGIQSALDDGIKWSFVVLGLLLAGYGLYFNERTKPSYVVQLDSPHAGVIQAYTSESEAEAAKIVDAINEAIA